MSMTIANMKRAAPKICSRELVGLICEMKNRKALDMASMLALGGYALELRMDKGVPGGYAVDRHLTRLAGACHERTFDFY
jgi:hypothetical protein